ncbi:putative ABC transporter permease [Treponema sp. OMZ 840]|uniref:putative ABC transporter permease n=1 Tax=Treponema sp. OMZ 840 TaxID=244313 RepID=UPI003D916780
MFTITFSRLFLLFIIYSTVGWICEVIYCGTLAHKFINRGFLHGPWCPVYGFGGLLVIGLLRPFKNNLYILYPAAFLITGILEYITGWLLEILFNTKWWDYSQRKFNIKGRVCLWNLLLFAAGGSIAVMFVHPHIAACVDNLSQRVRQYAALGLLAVFAADLALTLHKLVNFTEYLTRLEDFAESLKERYENEAWFKSQSLTDMFAAVKERSRMRKGEISERILQKIDSFSQRYPAVERFFKKFPSIQNKKRILSIEHIKAKINSRFK